MLLHHLLRRTDYGNENTSVLLKALEIVCRYHFLFFENASVYSSQSILAIREEDFPDMAANLLLELNLLRNSVVKAGLDKPNAWIPFADWSEIRRMGEDFRPRDKSIRQLLDKIVESEDDPNALPALRQELSSAILYFEETIRPHNERLIASMATQLSNLAQTTK
jgi:hypothetical protein